MSIEFNRVTWYSKLLAVILFVGVFGLGFWIGSQKADVDTLFSPPEQIACTADALICPDGSAVGRTGPNCQFAPCPTSSINLGNDAGAPDIPDSFEVQ